MGGGAVEPGFGVREDACRSHQAGDAPSLIIGRAGDGLHGVSSGGWRERGIPCPIAERILDVGWEVNPFFAHSRLDVDGNVENGGWTVSQELRVGHASRALSCIHGMYGNACDIAQ